MPPADRANHPDRAAFASLIIEEIRKAGEKGEIFYDEKEFRLRVEGEQSNYANLSNIYEEYVQAAPPEQERLLRNYVRSWFAPLKGLPEAYEDVHPDLLPSVRPRAYIELNLVRMRLQGIQDAGWPYVPLADQLAICLVYDLPESLMQIQQRHLEDWQVSFEEALEHSIENLRQMSNHRFQKLASGVWRSPWKDNLDASRLVLPELIRAHEIKGDPVVMVPNRDTLLLTGSEDEAGLSRLIEVATEEFEHARAISGFALRLEEDQWLPFLPDQEHPAFEQFRLLAIQSLGGDYSDQKELLQQQCLASGEDVFVANYSGMRDNETGRVFSYCVWSEGVETLLPRTDCLVFFRPDEANDQGEILGSASWWHAEEIIGDLLIPMPMYPQRYRVSQFPSEEQLQRLLAGAD